MTVTVLPPVSAPTVCLPDVSAPLFAVYVWRGIERGWERCSQAPRSQSDAGRLAALMRRAFPEFAYKVGSV